MIAEQMSFGALAVGLLGWYLIFLLARRVYLKVRGLPQTSFRQARQAKKTRDYSGGWKP
jgi:hypothetical protein